MKKLTALIIAAIMTLSLAGCTDSADETPATTKKGTEAAAVAETTATTAKAEAPAETTKAEEEDEPVAFTLDSSLENEALLASIPAMMPATLYTKTESVAANGTVVVSEMWTKEGGFFRSESNDPDMGKSVMVYNPIEGNMYVYNENEGMGMVSHDGPEEESDDDADVATDGATYLDYLTEDGMVMTAKVEDLDGVPVIHFHSEASEDGYTMVIDHWYSVDYMVLLKSETYMDGNMIASSRVLDYEVDPNIDDSLFEKPDGIEFVESPF